MTHYVFFKKGTILSCTHFSQLLNFKERSIYILCLHYVSFLASPEVEIGLLDH